MEMVDVLKKLQEIQTKSPEVKQAIQSTEAMNPKQQAAIAIAKKEKMKEHCHNFADFLRREGGELGKMDVQDIMAMADKYAQHKIEVSKDESMDEGRMKDILIGAEEAIGDYVNDDGDLKMPKRAVMADLLKKAKESSFPTSFEYETAAKMVGDKFDDSGKTKADMEPAMDSEQVNTNTMENKDKKPVNEAVKVKEDIKMTADTPQEANMLMQILQMAGLKPMGAEMPSSMTMPGDQMDPGELNKQMDVPTDGDEMSKFKKMVMKPDMEKAEENFANTPDEKVKDVDTLVNVHSGGLNRQKEQVRKEYPGDNPLAVKEDTISVEDLSNSLRTQYENFKKSYQDEAEVAEKQGVDHDKDGDIDSKDYLKSRDIAIKKAMADKKDK